MPRLGRRRIVAVDRGCEQSNDKATSPDIVSKTPSGMPHILITGASGFLGQDLATALLAKDPSGQTRLTLTDVVKPAVPANGNEAICDCIQLDLTSHGDVQNVLKSRYDAIYLLHGIMSGGSEASLDLGLAVNVDSFRLILDTIRNKHPGTKIIFPSSLAVYGPTGEGEVVSETTCPLPQSSYGSEKLIVETLINDFARRGLIDGRIARLPTVIVRPGAPSAAASSFASGIVRESLKGIRNVLPVEESLEMWVCSPKVVVENLIRLKNVDEAVFKSELSRVTCLPGQTVEVGEILNALKAVGGKEARGLVEKKRDEEVERIVKRYVCSCSSG
jgi:nucleoside-diphosphate-sugar epimerase